MKSKKRWLAVILGVLFVCACSTTFELIAYRTRKAKIPPTYSLIDSLTKRAEAYPTYQTPASLPESPSAGTAIPSDSDVEEGNDDAGAAATPEPTETTVPTG